MDLRRARILVANDDGINAPGIKVLEKIAKSLSDDVWTVAPESEQSASGHSLTLTLPLRIRRISRRRFAVNGTPTDSVLLGIQHIITGRRPDIVISGVNAGGNLGEDITYSGTVAAAMEGALMGIPSIAMSQVRVYGENVRWAVAEYHGAEVIRRLVALEWQHNVLINVNFPDVEPDAVTGIEVTVQGRRKIGDAVTTGRDPRGHDYVWIGTERNEDPSFAGSDLKAVTEGRISVTPLCLDLTHKGTLPMLREAFP